MLALIDGTADKPASLAEPLLYLENISGALNQTIDHLAELVKTQTAFDLSRTPVRFKEVFDSVIMVLTPSIKKANARIEGDFAVCPEINYVYAYLESILLNLISNAVKFTKDGTITIRVELVANNKQDVDLLFSIEDTGIGIPKEKQHLVFERFTQANNNITREFGGSGLGLTIIRRLLQLQGSEIFLESEPGVGSKFYFTLKFKKSNSEIREEAKQSGTENKPDLTGKRILLVEDVEFNIMVAQRMLKNWNAEVDLAENGSIAVEKVRQENYDLILMDIQMPIMDGLTALPEIKKLYPDIKVIMLSFLNDHSVISKMMELGANSYITKESGAELIYEAIRGVFENDFHFNDLTNKALLSGLRTKRSHESSMPADVQLTEKEITILKLMCDEKSTKEIADIVDLSPRTVEAIRDKLKVKTGSKSTAGLIMYAVKHKIIEEM